MRTFNSGGRPPFANESDIQVGKPRFEDDPARGFASPRNFFDSVMRQATAGETTDNLKSLAVQNTDGTVAFALPIAFTAGSDEHGVYTAPHGGLTVPEQLVGNLKMLPYFDPMAGRCQVVQMDAPTVKIPARVDKNHATSVSGGLRVFRRAETQTVDATRMEMELIVMQAHSLMGISYATEELLQDSAIGFTMALERSFREQFASQLATERIRGSGVAEFLGVLNSDCRIVVSQESEQGADTILLENLVKMRARCWGYPGAIWLYNATCLPELMTMTDAAGRLIWQPSARDGEPDRLLGRPAFECEECSALGDEGDIILGNFAEYLEGTYQPIQGASSIHVRFLNNERAFRFVKRDAGAPWWVRC